MSDGWSPDDYARFADDRRAPFFDLLDLVRAAPGGRVLDVGCGTGALTTEAHRRLAARQTVGVDSSAAMLAKATPAEGVQFVEGLVPAALPEGPFDVILSNSCLNWVPDHQAVLALLVARLAPGGQLAVQMPSNPDSAFSHAAERAAARLAGELDGFVYRSPVQPPETYARWLDELGLRPQRTGAWYYLQRHQHPDGLADFALGGLLSPYRERLAPHDFARFEKAYRRELALELGEGPVRFPFRRVFAWGRKA